MERSKSYRHILLILAVLTFIFIVGDGLRIIQLPPRSTHVFRQSDCIAYTKRYFSDNSPLLTPACYNLIGKDGRVASEFPILYFLSAKLCTLLGFHFWILRGLTLLCSIAGLVYLYLSVRIWINDTIIALFPVILVASAPYFFFYSVNFLPNVPAISFSFIGLYYLLRYNSTGKMLSLIIGTGFFMLAILLKPTDGGLVYAAYLLSMLMSKKAKAKSRPLAISALSIAVSGIWWFFFVKQYNELNGNDINLQGIYPIWKMTPSEIYDTFSFRLFRSGRECFHHPVLLTLSVVFLVVFIARWSFLQKFLRVFTAFLIVGAIAYSLLWYKAFGVHDYYQLALVIPAIFFGVTILEYGERVLWEKLQRNGKISAGIFLCCIMLAATIFNNKIQRQRYADDNKGFANIDVLYEAEPYLRKMGVSGDDIVLTVPDGSPNISLSAFGNRGFTSDLFSEGRYNVKYCVARGARYMIILNEDYIDNPAYKPYTSKPVGRYKFIHVYDLR
jgi:hypothetical protein